MIMERAGKVSPVILNHASTVAFVLGPEFGWNLQLTVSTDDSKSCKSILSELHTQFHFIYLDYILCPRARSLVKFFLICTKQSFKKKNPWCKSSCYSCCRPLGGAIKLKNTMSDIYRIRALHCFYFVLAKLKHSFLWP